MIVLVKVTFYLDSYLYKSLAVFLPRANNSLRYVPHQPCTELYFSKLRENKKEKHTTAD